MGAFSVDLDRLDQTVARLRRFDELIDDRMGEVDRRLRSLQDSWHGDAARAQRSAQNDWTVDAERLRAAMTLLRDAAATAHANYRAAAVANHQGWHR